MNLTRLPPRNTRATYANRPVTNDLVIPMVRLLHAPLHRYCADPLGWPSSFNANFLRSFVRRTSIPRSSRLAPATMNRDEEKKEREEKVTGPGWPLSLSPPLFLPVAFAREDSPRDFSTHLSSSGRAEYFSFPRAFVDAAKGSRPCFHAIGSFGVRGTRASGICGEILPFRKMLSLDSRPSPVCISIRKKCEGMCLFYV